MEIRPAKVLFILKFREGYGLTRDEASSGLLNSAKFVVNMLASNGLEVKLVQVTDNNDIDREVHNYQPTHVVIEAFWVVPEKFEVLRKLHPGVKWVIRAHSEIPFLAGEGVAMDWLIRYSQQLNVIVAANSERALRDFRTIVRVANPAWSRRKLERKVVYLPNFYPAIDRRVSKAPKAAYRDPALHIGCFGAIRPLKNQLIQAVAALRFAEETNRHVFFHVNASRTEQGGEQSLKNLRDLFANANHATLVEHAWMSHPDFLKVLPQIDLGMQVTFSETFNIVAADMVSAGIPVVVSPEIRWASGLAQASCTDSASILKVMHRSMGIWGKIISWLNFRGLRGYARRAEKVWLNYFTKAEIPTINLFKEGTR